MARKRAVLVYQAGIANVFEVSCFNANPHGRNAKRLLQHAFGPCEWFVKGLAHAGYSVTSMQCNQAGDVTEAQWSEDLDAAPFSDKFQAVFSGVKA